ncbi:MAG: hypothetical protein WAM90_16530 [Rhodanobacter sp.]
MKRLLLGTATAFITLAWSHASLADDLFGIALRHPIRIQECTTRQGDYIPDDNSQCFKWPSGAGRSSAIPANGQIIVNVPPEDRPAFMSGADVVVGLSNGLVASVSAKTHGAPEDTQDLGKLERLFGKSHPQYLSSNQPYPSYQSIRADWTLQEDETVYFNSTEFGMYYGLVRIQTASATQHQPSIWD